MVKEDNKKVDITDIILYNLSKEAVKEIIANKLKRAKYYYDAQSVIRNQENVVKQYYLD